MPVNIRFRKGLEEALIYIPFGESLSRAKNFASAISAYTTASIPYVWATARGTSNTEEKSGDIQDINLYAHVFLRRARDNKLYALKIHAPNYAACFDIHQEVPKNVGDTLASIYSALAGETFTFHCGALAGKGIE